MCKGMPIAQFLSITNIDLNHTEKLENINTLKNIKTQHLSQVLCTETSRKDGSEQNRSSKDCKKSSITNNRLNFLEDLYKFSRTYNVDCFRFIIEKFYGLLAEHVKMREIFSIAHHTQKIVIT